MKLHLDNPDFSAPFHIKHNDRLFFIGSCFADTMSDYFNERKFSILQNPFGVLYNPHSIERSFRHIESRITYDVNDFYKRDDIYISWDHHSCLYDTSSENLKFKLDRNNQDAYKFLQNTDVVFITLGTAWVNFLLEKKQTVANNHKAPSNLFEKRILSSGEIEMSLKDIVLSIRKIKKDVKIVWTLSPVRHSKQGLAENNLSKASLLQSIHGVCAYDGGSVYFPSYEIVVDVLRDYRFYKEDLVHPNKLAIDYLWNFLESNFISSQSQEIMRRCLTITQATKHRVMHPDSQKGKEFIENTTQQLHAIKERYPYIDFSKEEIYFDSL